MTTMNFRSIRTLKDGERIQLIHTQEGWLQIIPEAAEQHIKDGNIVDAVFIGKYPDNTYSHNKLLFAFNEKPKRLADCFILSNEHIKTFPKAQNYKYGRFAYDNYNYLCLDAAISKKLNAITSLILGAGLLLSNSKMTSQIMKATFNDP